MTPSNLTACKVAALYVDKRGPYWEMPKSQRHITPPEFAEALIAIARNSNVQERAA